MSDRARSDAPVTNKRIKDLMRDFLKGHRAVLGDLAIWTPGFMPLAAAGDNFPEQIPCVWMGVKSPQIDISSSETMLVVKTITYATLSELLTEFPEMADCFDRIKAMGRDAPASAGASVVNVRFQDHIRWIPVVLDEHLRQYNPLNMPPQRSVDEWVHQFNAWLRNDSGGSQ